MCAKKKLFLFEIKVWLNGLCYQSLIWHHQVSIHTRGSRWCTGVWFKEDQLISASLSRHTNITHNTSMHSIQIALLWLLVTISVTVSYTHLTLPTILRV